MAAAACHTSIYTQRYYNTRLVYPFRVFRRKTVVDLNFYAHTRKFHITCTPYGHHINIHVFTVRNIFSCPQLVISYDLGGLQSLQRTYTPALENRIRNRMKKKKTKHVFETPSLDLKTSNPSRPYLPVFTTATTT